LTTYLPDSTACAAIAKTTSAAERVCGIIASPSSHLGLLGPAETVRSSISSAEAG
jgi:hypothetical protein